MKFFTLFCFSFVAWGFAEGTGARNHGKLTERFRQPATWRMTASANRLFAYRLFTNIARKQELGNILISPFTVSTALSMALLGAKHETADEIMKALGYKSLGQKRNGEDYSQDDVPRLYKSFLGQMQKSTLQRGYILRIASKLYGDSSEQFLDEFIDGTERYYDARFEQLEFASDPEVSRDIINDWVSDKTEGMIEEALPDGSISSNTLIVLVSSVFFQGSWKYPFDSSLTYEDIFTTDEKKSIRVPYMQSTITVGYTTMEKPRTHIVILPYDSPDIESEIVMELYLPDNPENLKMIEQMKSDDFQGALKRAHNETLDIHLPKFRFDYKRDLRGSLEDFGIQTLWGAADLSGMNGKRNLNFGAVHHSTAMEVNEKGTKASGATAAIFLRSRPQVIVFDHPFLVIIRKTNSNTVLFMGRVADPLG